MARNLWNEPDWYGRGTFHPTPPVPSPALRPEPEPEPAPSPVQPTVIVVPSPAATPAPAAPVVVHAPPPPSGAVPPPPVPLFDGLSWGLLVMILIMFGLLVAVHVRTSCTQSTIMSLHAQTQATLRDLQAELRAQRMRSWLEHQFKP